ncbi:MAG: U32 family peptidase [Elusimicrobiales bacterium]|nr:U32 family peptidase [Elusimicrobiales bacterium]
MTGYGIKIQAGVGGFAEMRRFIAAGADELYGGISSVPSHVYGADNFSSPGELLRAAAEARAAGLKFFFVANEVGGRLLEHAARVIKKLGPGVDGVIVKDLALLRRLAELKVKGFYILSTLACCYNSRTLELYRRLGVRRLALPEHLTPAEAAGMMRRGVGTEVFIKAREYCVNANGLCFLQFGPENRCFCRDEFRAAGKAFRMPGPSAAEQFGQLYDFVKLGARTIKVGRSPRPEGAALVFKEASALRDMLEAGEPRGSFVKKALRVHAAIEKGFDALRAGEARK